jgi:hypothetical protein
MENRNMALLKLLRRSLVILACLLCLCQSGFSGELSDFEQDATSSENNNKTENGITITTNIMAFGTHSSMPFSIQ